MINELTSGAIKSRAGLDNTDVQKGHDNFEQMRSLVNAFANLAGEMVLDKKIALLQKIDEVQAFHKVDFERHLDCNHECKHACMCLHCGFFDEEKDPIKCTQAHKDFPCGQCQESIELIMNIHDFHRLVEDILKSQSYRSAPELEDDLLTWKDDIHRCCEYLLHYRAHIVHKHSEAKFDKDFYFDLKEGEAVVIIDYKMKILSSKHREAQKDWFSKRGTSVLGAEIHIKTKEGIKVIYHLFISDDTHQDAEAVLCAKHFLYQVVLPTYNVKEIKFRSDGAGCFSSMEAKAAMKMWDDLARENGGCYETAYKVMVAGCGKTALDGENLYCYHKIDHSSGTLTHPPLLLGMFGVLTMHLARLVNYGHSFEGAEDIYNLLKRFPLQHSEFHLFKPNRKLLIWPAPAKNCQLKQFYLVEYERDNQIASGKYHSGHGTKVEFDADVEEGLKRRTAVKSRKKKRPDDAVTDIVTNNGKYI